MINLSKLAETLLPEETSRPDWENYFMALALTVASRASCLRSRFGVVIVNNNHRILSTGYNGAPSGMIDSLEAGNCLRESLNIPHGQNYEICRAIHAEQNALKYVTEQELNNSDIFIAGIDPKTKRLINAYPCVQCQRSLINYKLNRLYVLKDTGSIDLIFLDRLRQEPRSLIKSLYAPMPDCIKHLDSLDQWRAVMGRQVENKARETGEIAP
jgi:dCMP deaminase